MKNFFDDKKKIAIVLIAVVAIALIGVGLVFLSKSSGHNKLNNELAIAHQFMESGDYDSAMAAFDRALEIDPTCVDAYLGKAEVTVSLGDYSAAISTLQAGYELTQSQLLDDKIDEYEKALEEEKRLEEERARLEAEEAERLEKEARKEATKLEAKAKKQAKIDADAALEQIEICGVDLKTAYEMSGDEWKRLIKQVAAKNSYIDKRKNESTEDDYYLYDMYIYDGENSSAKTLLHLYCVDDKCYSIDIFFNANAEANRINDYVKLPDYFPNISADLTVDELSKWADDKLLGYRTDSTKYAHEYDFDYDYDFVCDTVTSKIRIFRWQGEDGSFTVCFDL